MSGIWDLLVRSPIEAGAQPLHRNKRFNSNNKKMYESRLTTHFKIVGALLIAYSALQFLGGVALLTVFNVVDIFIDEREVLAIVQIVTRTIGILILLVAIPGMIAGIGLLVDKLWARPFSLIMGIVYNRIEMFVDISLVYALLNFIATLAVAKYLEVEGE